MAEWKRQQSGGLTAALTRFALRPLPSRMLRMVGNLVAMSPSDSLRRRGKQFVERIDHWNLMAADRDAIDAVKRADSELRRSGSRRPRLLFFQSLPWQGGNWEFSKQLIEGLALVRRRIAFDFSLALHPDQNIAEAGSKELAGIELLRSRLVRVHHRGDAWCCFDAVGMRAALEADAWISLTDRFPFPLLPLRPYGVVVHDVIQRHCPEAFGPAFDVWRMRGMRPTVSRAERVFVTSNATANDARKEYGVADDKLRIIPVAFDPSRRFAGLDDHPSEAASGDESRPFLLCVGNASPHKGHDTLITAFAEVRRMMKGDSPALVCAGVDTDEFSVRSRAEHAHFRRIRRLVAEFGLAEDADVFFLGYVSAERLASLYRRCIAVVNPARFDNGTYCLLEAAYFDKPLICADYPAARELALRFRIDCHWFEVGDSPVLARWMLEAAKGLISPAHQSEPSLRVSEGPFSPATAAESFAKASLEMVNSLTKL